jgi:protein involved in sex pheromone biosynthesis
MKRVIVPVVASVLALAACRTPLDDASKQQREQEQEQQVSESARKAGRTAYDVAQNAEDAVKLLAHDIKAASVQAKQGWDQARREHQQNSCQQP